MTMAGTGPDGIGAVMPGVLALDGAEALGGVDGVGTGVAIGVAVSAVAVSAVVVAVVVEVVAVVVGVEAVAAAIVPISDSRKTSLRWDG
jgi:hypothetical protein